MLKHLIIELPLLFIELSIESQQVWINFLKWIPLRDTNASVDAFILLRIEDCFIHRRNYVWKDHANEMRERNETCGWRECIFVWFIRFCHVINSSFVFGFQPYQTWKSAYLLENFSIGLILSSKISNDNSNNNGNIKAVKMRIAMEICM